MALNLPFDLDDFNREIEIEVDWCVAALKAEMGRLGIRSTKIVCKTFKRDGVINRVRFIFPKYLIYVHKGAGRGQGGYKGSTWQSKNGVTIKTNPNSLNKMNTGKRKAKEWFNPVIELFVDRVNRRMLNYFVIISYKRLKIK